VVFNLSLDKGFDYFIPEALLGQVRPGTRVKVNLRQSVRSGYVIAVKGQSEYDDLRPILELESTRQQIPTPLLRLGDWLADYYCCPREHAVRVLLPAVVRSGAMTHKRVMYISLGLKSANPGAAGRAQLTPRREQVLQALRQHGAMPLQRLLEVTGVSAQTVTALCRDEWLHKEMQVVNRDPFQNDLVQPDSPRQLTAQQTAALDAINASLDRRDSQVFLLHGVTASGKTEVYLQTIRHCLELGREAIVLVPEISLTPQTCEHFRRRFGNQVSVLHSSLSDGERFDEWTRINEGRSKIAVGARSALFAPFRALGLIVVDEEHEGSYKQEDSPRYHARDVAVVRGKMEKATVVLGTATPSLESFYNCQQGRYQLLEMPERVENYRMPTVEIIDMAQEAALAGKAQLFSRRLRELVMDRLARAEQVILFLNRRGYATQMICPDCGFVATCDNCSVSYTYHRQAGQLLCHLCGAQLPAPAQCPQCGKDGIRYTGVGTEKIEAAARAVFPQATIARMDSDTMTAKDSYRKVLDAFRAGRIDILIGTQMIAKGLDFPNVTLVGIIQADSGLHLPDFRSGERTFQLVTQVSGRAGRGEVDGHVILQTYTPYHFALQTAIKHDFTAFYAEEFPSRQMLAFPPCTHLAIVHFRSTDFELARQAAEDFATEAVPLLPEGTQVIGPMPAPLAKVKTYHRFQLLLRGEKILAIIRVIRPRVVGCKPPKNVDIHIDVDPRSLL
jgi:primosomal protein N' (replication factor Y)